MIVVFFHAVIMFISVRDRVPCSNRKSRFRSIDFGKDLGLVMRRAGDSAWLMYLRK